MNSLKCLECDFCKLILAKPVILPCGKTLCHHHLEDTNELMFSCMFCLEEHHIPKNGFKISDRLSFMIDFQIELNPLRKQIKESFAKLNQAIQDYESINSDGFVFDYFAEIFNKVDLHREELMKEINERYDEIIKQLKDKQEKCKLNLKNVEKINLNELKNEIIPHFQLKLRISDIDLEDLNDIYSKMSVHLKKTQFETKKLKNDLLLGEAISFEKHEKNSSFGDLILKNFDFVLSNECGKLIRSYEKQSRANFFHIDAKSNRLLIASNDKTVKKALEISQLFRHSEYLTETFNMIQSCRLENEKIKFSKVEEQNFKSSLPKLLKQIVLRRQEINYIIVGFKKSNLEVLNKDIDNF